MSAPVAVQNGRTALMAAAGKGDLTIVQALLAAGSDVQAIDSVRMISFSLFKFAGFRDELLCLCFVDSDRKERLR